MRSVLISSPNDCGDTEQVCMISNQVQVKVISDGGIRAILWHYLPLPDGASRDIITIPGRGGGRPGCRWRTWTQGRHPGRNWRFGKPWRDRRFRRPWRDRRFGKPWRIRGLGRPWRSRRIGRPWRGWRLGKPWRIRGLGRPWPISFGRPWWVRDLRGLGSGPGHPGRGYIAPPPNFLGEAPLWWAFWRSGLLRRLWRSGH